MLGEKYKDLEHEEVFDTIEEALLTKCPICGTELEWKLEVRWNSEMDMPRIFGKSFSCGVDFYISPDPEGYFTERSDMISHE
jgi:hypothetical protein